MNTEERKRVEAAGFKSMTVAEFLELTPEESAIVEARAALARLIRETRGAHEISQTVLAKRIKTSQARLSKAEAADKGVSLDQLFMAALNAGASLDDIGNAIISANQ